MQGTTSEIDGITRPHHHAASRSGSLSDPPHAAIVFARPEYAALAEEFGFLASAFGQVISPSVKRDIARLASSIERIDRRVDEARDDIERRARWSDVVALLEDEDDNNDNVSKDHEADPDQSKTVTRTKQPELMRAARDLRELAIERDVLARVRRIVRDEARTSEAIRSAKTMRSFIRNVEREGHLTAALAVAVAGRDVVKARSDFRRFFARLAAPANLVDKILDARGDHAIGEIAIPPNAIFYLMLGLALLRRSARLALACRRPTLVLRLGYRYLGPTRAR